MSNEYQHSYLISFQVYRSGTFTLIGVGERTVKLNAVLDADNLPELKSNTLLKFKNDVFKDAKSDLELGLVITFIYKFEK